MRLGPRGPIGDLELQHQEPPIISYALSLRRDPIHIIEPQATNVE